MASSVRALLGAVLAFAAATVFAAPAEGPPVESAAAQIRAFLDASGSPQPLCGTGDGRALWAAVGAFYAARGDRPAWIEGGRPTPAGERLIAALQGAEAEGLDPRRYAGALRAGALPAALPVALEGEPPERAWARREVGLTTGLALEASDLFRGRVDPRPVSPRWRFIPRTIDVGSILRQAAESGRPDRVLDSLRPSHPQYAALVEAWRRYAELARQEPAVPPVGAGPLLRPGARSPRVRALRARLAFWGDLASPDPPGPADVLDGRLVEGLKRFQARHGLESRGLLDLDTVAALDTPASQRRRQIALNLERWRWQERESGRRFVLVNVPTFSLQAYEDGREALAMRVVTGGPDTPTPVFTQEMTAVVFSPWWNVPPGIAQDETLPAVRHDRGYLHRMNLEVMRGGEVVDPARVDWRAAPSVSFR